MLLIFLFITLSAQTVLAESILKPFVSDGCTMFADGPPRAPKLWTHCCEEHDLRYWFGGNQADMDKTDLKIRSCVKDVAGATWAEVIYAGIRAGHSSPIKNKFRWSWGWTIDRPNVSLTQTEKDHVQEELRRLPYDRDYIEKFIEQNF